MSKIELLKCKYYQKEDNKVQSQRHFFGDFSTSLRTDLKNKISGISKFVQLSNSQWTSD